MIDYVTTHLILSNSIHTNNSQLNKPWTLPSNSYSTDLWILNACKRPIRNFSSSWFFIFSRRHSCPPEQRVRKLEGDENEKLYESLNPMLTDEMHSDSDEMTADGKWKLCMAYVIFALQKNDVLVVVFNSTKSFTDYSWTIKGLNKPLCMA